jgi:hypothetical protein
VRRAQVKGLLQLGKARQAAAICHATAATAPPPPAATASPLAALDADAESLVPLAPEMCKHTTRVPCLQSVVCVAAASRLVSVRVAAHIWPWT